MFSLIDSVKLNINEYNKIEEKVLNEYFEGVDSLMIFFTSQIYFILCLISEILIELNNHLLELATINYELSNKLDSNREIDLS